MVQQKLEAGSDALDLKKLLASNLGLVPEAKTDGDLRRALHNVKHQYLHEALRLNPDFLWASVEVVRQ